MDDSTDNFDAIDLDEKILVRQRIRSGRLPPGPVNELFGGTGTGALCSCCDRVISADQIAFEIHAASDGSEQLRLMMHSHCMRIWYDEWAP
jgi:hypothetical protein